MIINNNARVYMTQSTIAKFNEYNAQYVAELQAIDAMINSQVITLAEYRRLLADAWQDYRRALATI